MEERFLMGVDLGGSHVVAGVVDAEGRILSRADGPIDLNDTPDVILRGSIGGALKEALAMAGVPRERVAGIGLGLPGNLNVDEGLCIFSPNFQWRNVQVRAPLQEELGLPVFIQNDVRTITLGEKHFGPGGSVSSFVCVWLGTGVGGGIVIDGRLYTGACGSAGEIGHITVNPDGPSCNCGSRGCIEAYASGTGVARRCAELLDREPSVLLASLAEKRGKATAAVVYEAARLGDKAAIELWSVAGRYLGVGLSTILTTVNPELVIVGGRVADAWEFFAPSMMAEIEARVKMVPKEYIRIVRSQLGQDAGVLGGAALARERLSGN